MLISPKKMYYRLIPFLSAKFPTVENIHLEAMWNITSYLYNLTFDATSAVEGANYNISVKDYSDGQLLKFIGVKQYAPFFDNIDIPSLTAFGKNVSVVPVFYNNC